LGDIVVVLLDTDTYESLSDLDIHNVMSDLVEEHAPVYQAHIVESEAAADALFVDEPTEAEQNALDNHYLARLEEGFRIVYVGPLEDSCIAILRYLCTRTNMAVSRNPPKPTTSVTVVRKMFDASAGS